MKAIVQDEYGPPDVLELREVDPPAIREREVLVRVRAAAVHPGDLFLMEGWPRVLRVVYGLRRPKRNIPGFDVAGIVEVVGAEVRHLHPGDEVFGNGRGTCAEYTSASEGELAPKPDDLSFEQAAAVPTSAVAALRGIRDAGKVRPGQKVLINGASGGVGTFAVQIAKALGAEVTAVCSTANADLVRSLGADHVIDYTREDFTRGGRRFDLILDNVASHPLSETRRALAPGGVLLPNSGRSGGAWFGPLGRIALAFVLSPFIRGQGRQFVATVKAEDLVDITEMIEAGRVRPVVERTYPLGETPDALRHVARGHTRGKVVISVSEP
ncbi:MAG TPA: NAD(P)-dependent alcohol dehydrogenase [Actinomycetota bacterium]